jgi:selenocysteine-specific translation elongation factor
MGNLNVAMIGPIDYAKDLAKKGTSTDITLYDIKKDQDTVTLIEPTKYPERIAPLFYSVSMANLALVVVDEINAQLGECILMLDCAGVEQGFFILRNYITPDKIAPFIKGTKLEKYQYIENNPVEIREMLLGMAAKLQPDAAPTKVGSIPIDHHFNVKGVGTVILGYVATGGVRKHETLKVLPTAKSALVRSIQKHDDDFDVAFRGDRVGLALKGIEADELDRGYVLTNDESIKVETTLKVQAELIKYWPSSIKEGMVLHVCHWMQFVPARVTGVDNGNDWKKPILTLSLEKGLIHPPGSRAVLTQLEGGKLRIAGTVLLP